MVAHVHRGRWIIAVQQFESDEGTPKIMNRSGQPARTLLFSSSRAPAVSVYPDSDTIGVWSGDEENDLVFRRSTAPWSHGEDA